MRAFALAAIAFLLPLTSGNAHADEVPTTPAAEVSRGVALFEDLEYKAAAEVLAKALETPDLPVTSRITGLRFLGLAQVAIGEENGARDSFRRLLELDRNAELDSSASPRARELLNEVRSDLPGVVKLAFSEEPAGGSQGTPLSFSFKIEDPSAIVAGVVLHYAASETAKSSTVQATRLSKNGDYTATIPSAFVRAPYIYYYVSALASSGKVLATIGSRTERRLLAVMVPTKASSSGVSPLVWGGEGAVAIAAGGAAIYFLTRDSTATENVTVIFE